jgi:hypothetical protein
MTAPTGRALTYALVTPASNEAEFIERTLVSVIAQTARPERWIVVSNGSCDGTNRIVQAYAQRHPWIELLPLERAAQRSFAHKASAFNAGYRRLEGTGVDLVGNLDADVSMAPEFFAFLLRQFAGHPRLGVAGGVVIDVGGAPYDYRFTNVEHVSGACQLFRRTCLDAIGGYAAAEGAIDTIAVTSARMHGWQTRTFVEKALIHHRPLGRASGSGVSTWWRQGRKDYALGNSLGWQLARGAYQTTRAPWVIRGAVLSAGYLAASVGSVPQVPDDLRAFVRGEQRRRVRRVAARWLGRASPSAARIGGAPELSLEESAFRLGAWVEAQNFSGYEPFDGQSSYLRPLTLGLPFLERVLQQAVRRSPVNVRPLLGIRPRESTKGRGAMARGYLARWRMSGADADRANAVACLDWLIAHTSRGVREASWGNHFDFTSRAGRHRAGESILVWTSLIGQAFLDAFERLGDERYLDVARSVCRWILALPRETTPDGCCLSYLAARQLSIHNANLLGAAMLARTARHTGDSTLIDVARAAVRYSCAAQRPDGAWCYAEASAYRWIDSFHTGYNLDSLLCYQHSTGDVTFATHLDRGFRFFADHFAAADGTPRYYHDRTYPIDIQSAAQIIETFATFADRDPDALDRAETVARWTIRHMQDPAGYFYFRKSPRLTTKTPMLHWGQATMFRALTLLAWTRQRAAEALGVESV